MAAFVRTRFDNNFVDKRRGDNDHFTGALGGESIAGGRSRRSILLRAPSFVVEGTTDTNTAALNAGAAQSFLMNLSGEGGVSFPSGFDRDIDVLVYSRDETDRNFQWIRQTVRGGSDPTLINGVRNMGPLVGGRVTFATAAATAAEAYGGFSITSVATNTGRYAATIPKARRAYPVSLAATIMGTATDANFLTAHLNAITLATGVIEIGFRRLSDGANTAPADTNQLIVEFDLLPVENPELAIVTTTSPDQVIIGAVGQASENVRWYAEVYVGDLYPNNLATASE